MGVTLTIAGVDRRGSVIHSSLRIQKDDEVETCSFETRDPLLTAGAYRPAFGDVVRVHQDGALLFGGTVEEVDDAASDFIAGSTRVQVRAIGYHLKPQQVTVRKSYSAGQSTLAVYADLFAACPGVSYIGAGSGGPTLPALAFDRCVLADALNQVKRISGYPWRINGDLQAWAGLPGADTGPALTDANGRILRQFAWSRQRTARATRVWCKTGNTGATARTQSWTGNGTRTRFYVDVEPTVVPTQVDENGTIYAVPSGTWTWDATRLCLTRSSALGNGVPLAATYTVEYPAWCRAQDETAIDAGDVVELAYAYPDVLELPQGVALAAGHLAQQAITPKTVRLSTREVNVYPLMKCNLSFAARLVSGDYLVRSVAIAPFGNDWAASGALLYTLSLVEGTTLNANWLDYWRDRLGATRGTASAPSSAGGVTVVTGSPSHVWGNERTRGVQVATWADVANHLDWIALTSDPLTVTCERRSAAAGTTVTVRVYDVTAAAAAVTGAATNATTWTEEGLTFTPVVGHRYRLQLAGSNTTNAVYAVGRH